MLRLDAVSATERAGSGPPLVIVPGVMADAASWQPVVDALDVPNPVIVLNRRGRAGSAPIEPGHALRTEIDDLHRLLDHLGTEVELFGWSYGGLLALEASVERAGIRSLIAYDPVSRPFAPHALAPLRDALARGDLDRAVEIVNIDVSGFTAADVAALRDSPQWSVLRGFTPPLADELAAVAAYEPRHADYARSDIPLTLLFGELNEGTEPYGTAFARFAAAVPRARIVRLAETGHLAHAQAPALLAGYIGEALGTCAHADPAAG